MELILTSHDTRKSFVTPNKTGVTFDEMKNYKYYGKFNRILSLTPVDMLSKKNTHRLSIKEINDVMDHIKMKFSETSKESISEYSLGIQSKSHKSESPANEKCK